MAHFKKTFNCSTQVDSISLYNCVVSEIERLYVKLPM